MSITFLLFTIGFFNNLCSFLTFKRCRSRQHSVGNYLLWVTILNVFALLFLLLKLIYIVLESSGVFNGRYQYMTNLVACKAISYLLLIFTRVTYWLQSWISLNRLLIIKFPNVRIVTQPSIATAISLVTFVIIATSHFHEILYLTVVEQGTSTVCVSNFNHRFIMKYNQVTTFLHYFGPFFIQTLCITILLFLVARSRAKTSKSTLNSSKLLMKQFTSQRELYAIPAIIVFSSLPQIVFCLTLACIQLSTWQHLLLTSTYLLSYIPQILGFLLFVLPSTLYKQEFNKTYLGGMFFRLICKQSVPNAK